MADDRLRELLTLVEQSLAEPEWSGPDLAAAAHLSRYHFDRLVKSATGESPGGMRRRLLLERAAFQLRATDDRVIDIALAAGYATPEAFSRSFRRAFDAAPTAYRRAPTTGYLLAINSAVHFQPPGGLRLPPELRSTTMDVLTAMYDHHVATTRAIVERLDQLPSATLDAPIESSVPGIDDDPTLRSVTARLVGQLEMWTDVLDASAAARPAQRSPAALLERLDAVAPQFELLVVAPIRAGAAATTFLDATCDPPQTFSLGGVLAHVLTFSAVRRTLAIGALDAAGITDLGSGDPMHAVGGSGDDANSIRRPDAPTD